MHTQPAPGPHPYLIGRIHLRTRLRAIQTVVLLKCVVCGKDFAEEVHVEEFDWSGNFVLKLLDEDLFQRFSPLSVQEFEKHFGNQ
jgi:hypothetical protein